MVQEKPFQTNPDVEIEGLAYYPNFLSQEEQERVVAVLDSKPWSHVIRRRQQFYGETYYHTTVDMPPIQPMEKDSGEPYYDMSELQFVIDRLIQLGVFSKEKYPTQILVNEYVENMGISSHFEDEHAFGDLIATVSLLNPIYMTLKKPVEKTNACQDILAETGIYLGPGSLFLMSGEARYEWRHGITKAKRVFIPNTDRMVRRDASYRRISLTIRVLLNGRKRAQ